MRLTSEQGAAVMGMEQGRQLDIAHERWKASPVGAVQCLTQGQAALPVYVCPSCAALVADRTMHDEFHQVEQRISLVAVQPKRGGKTFPRGRQHGARPSQKRRSRNGSSS